MKAAATQGGVSAVNEPNIVAAERIATTSRRHVLLRVEGISASKEAVTDLCHRRRVGFFSRLLASQRRPYRRSQLGCVLQVDGEWPFEPNS